MNDLSERCLLCAVMDFEEIMILNTVIGTLIVLDVKTMRL